MSCSPYMPAALLLGQIWETKKSIKTLAYHKSGELKFAKSAYAQVCHVLEHQRALQDVLKSVPIQCRNEGLLYVLLFELLLGPNQKIRGGGALKRQIMNKEVKLREVLGALNISAPTPRVSFPRYVRVNTLKCTMDEAISAFKPQSEPLYVDVHVPNLLVLKPAARVHDHDFVKSGKVVLQDKSSCFSALCLVHGNEVPLHGDCLDACAAPGNKTSHLAALTDAKVVACDRNEKRLEMLDRRMKQLVSNKRVMTKHVDFLKTRPSDFSNVKGILLDPSCSGSGLFTSLDRLADEEDGEERIEKLSNFQEIALKHAMTFRSVERIVYSTCSLHEQENELVVKQALESNSKWQLCAPHCLRDWKRRGHDIEGLTKEQSQCLIRADRGDDTNGFFVAYFERRGSSKPTQVKGKKSGNVVVPEGLSVYEGEFASNSDVIMSEAPKRQPDRAKPLKLTAKPKKVVAKPEKIAAKPRKIVDMSQDNPDKVLAKKRAKKVAWKQQQIEQKKQRLLKKKKQKS